MSNNNYEPDNGGSNEVHSLQEEINCFVRLADHNYKFNSKADTITTAAGICLSLGIVISGVYQRADLATILGALVTATFTAQRAFPFNQRWQFYRTLLSQAQNLAMKLKLGLLAPDEAVIVLGSLRLDYAQQVPRGSKASTEEDHYSRRFE